MKEAEKTLTFANKAIGFIKSWGAVFVAISLAFAFYQRVQNSVTEDEMEEYVEAEYKPIIESLQDSIRIMSPKVRFAEGILVVLIETADEDHEERLKTLETLLRAYHNAIIPLN